MLLAALSVPAFAQTSSDTAGSVASASIGDIVVTATRRDATISSVPLSVIAMDRDRLDREGLSNVADLSRATPGLSLRNGWGDATKISIRGIASSVGTATTGIYIDDTPIQVRSLGAADIVSNSYPEIFDLERVEVLRGPQGTLFGAGSEGGTVRFITAAPSLDETRLYGKASIATTKGGAASYSAGASVSTPLVDDKIGISLTGMAKKDGGWIDRAPFETGVTADTNINSRKTVSLRAAAAFAPNESLTLTPAIFYQRWRRHDTNQYWDVLSDRDDGRYVSGAPIAQPARDRFFLPSLKGELELGGVKLITNTSWLDQRGRTTIDYSYHNVEGLSYVLTQGQFVLHNLLPSNFTAPSAFESRHRAFTQEARLQSDNPGASLVWTVGAFYQNSRQSTQQDIFGEQFPTFIGTFTSFFPPFVALPVPAVFGVDMLSGDRSYASRDRAKDTQLAGFGQIDWKATDRLTLTAGGRVARTKVSFANFQEGPLNFGTSASSGSAKETPFTPKFGVSYQPDRNSLIYANAAKGFRPGGGNTSVPALCAADLAVLGFNSVPSTYKSDSVWSYEVGGKTTGADGRVSIQASAFHIDWKNIQQSIALFRCGFSYTANLGAAVSNGFDIQLSVKPLGGLTLSGSVAYADGHYKRGVSVETSLGAVPLVTSGDELPSPPWQIHASGIYDFRVGGSPAYIQLNYDYADGYQRLPTAFNTDNRVKFAESTHFVSGRAGLQIGQVEAAVFVDNVFNSTDSTFHTFDSIASVYDRRIGFRPRTFGFELTFRN